MDKELLVRLQKAITLAADMAHSLEDRVDYDYNLLAEDLGHEPGELQDTLQDINALKAELDAMKVDE